MRGILLSSIWFMVIVVCECLKWIAAANLAKYIPFLRHLTK